MAPNMYDCVALVSIFLSWQNASAFTPANIIGLQQHQQHVVSILTKLTASIYYPEDDGGLYQEDTTSDDVFGNTKVGTGGRYGMSLFGQLAAQLSSDPATISTLARLASAFSPPGFTFDLANVNDVRCSSLDNRHMEIEALVCDDTECSSLLVPVEFPEECAVDDAGFAECVLRNVGRLDVAGEHVLRERNHVFAQEAEAERALEAMHTLESEYLKSTSAYSSFPDWWVSPSSSEDVSDCRLLEELLNGDDMHDVMRDLSIQVLQRSGKMGEGGWVRTVRVTAVGPLGIILKVHLSVGGKTWQDEGGVNNEAVMNVPVKYDEIAPPVGYGSGYGQRSIREEVLTMVSAVSSTR
mmetsp:Transcript_19585/g.29701  ORF Transcript_19585/g.29701 Transcript_19585/m.29701 type:complete len:353 (+) Transcript_19585:112-1170(+)|eukprot:CAMPEP_0196138596 /NCGR_PEP_ID=MMETSP0910-20130528/6180_1 /TAXON_ID=49265 /ORGANISM="Thalassiosira rotula, Strain GSO102" /LENGTH=352 /DNA_ID=CAMNT_0041399221 /DNA_START=81 /DNA_END=1139 /DNA_ORIENTATION=-